MNRVVSHVIGTRVRDRRPMVFQWNLMGLYFGNQLLIDSHN